MPPKPPKPSRPRTKAVAEVRSRPPSSAELVEALFSVPEIRQELEQESFTRADIELALDDRGWLTPNARTFQELDPATRNIKISQSRMYWVADPLAKQAVRLHTDYTVGSGMSYHCDDEKIQKQLDAFMKDRRNRRITSATGQRRSFQKLLIDADLFFLFFRSPSNTDTPLIRYLDPLQVGEIITAEHDSEQILGYKRTDAQGKNIYYRDWTAEDEELDGTKDPQTKEPITWETKNDSVIYHLPFDALDKRGNGLLSTALGWTREHRRFMEARVALTQSLAKFAWKLTAKVGEKGIQAIQNRLQSSLSTTGFTGAPERNPPNAPAGTFATNAGADMIPMPRITGSSDAYTDGRMLRQMVCAATGMFEHYLMGDGANANLASATAMELPMLKMFGAEQQLLQDAYRDIFSIVLGEEPGQEQSQIAIDFPPILSDDLQKLGTFVSQVSAIFPEIKIPQVLRLLLTSMNIADVGEVMDAAEEKADELRAEQDVQRQSELEKLRTQLKQGQPQPSQPTPQPALSEESLRKFSEAVKDFNKGLERLAGVMA